MKKKSKWQQIISLLAVSVIGVFVLISISSTTRADNDKRPVTPITLATFPGEPFFLEHIALKNGIYSKNGLDVTTLTPQGGAQAIQFLAAGAINGWEANPVVALPAIDQGRPLVLAGMLDGWITFAVQMRDDGSLPSEEASFQEVMSALKGKTIGVSGIGAVTDIALGAALKLAGLPADSVTIVAIGTAQSAAGQLKAKRLDGYVTFANVEAGVLKAEAGTFEYFNFTRDERSPAQLRAMGSLAMLTSMDYFQNNPSALPAWIDSLKDALDWARENPDEAGLILSESSYGGKYLEECRQAVHILLDSTAGKELTMKVNRSNIESLVSLMLETGSIKNPKNYEDIVLPFAREN